MEEGGARNVSDGHRATPNRSSSGLSSNHSSMKLETPPQKKKYAVFKKKWFPDRRFPDSIRLLGPEAVIRSLIQWGEMLATCSQKTKRVRDSKIEPFDLLWTEWPRIANQVRFVKVGFLYFVWRPSYTRNKKQQRRPNQRIISFENWPNNRCP